MERSGKTESAAIELAIGIVKKPPVNWGPEARAAAAKAAAEWEAKKGGVSKPSVSSKARGVVEGLSLADRVVLRTAARRRLGALQEVVGGGQFVALAEAASRSRAFAPEQKRVASAQTERERIELHLDGQHVGTVASKPAFERGRPDRWRAMAVNGRTIGDQADSKSAAMGLLQQHLEDAVGRIAASPSPGKFLVAEPPSYGGPTRHTEFPSESAARFEAGLPERPTRLEQQAQVAALGEMLVCDVLTLAALGESLDPACVSVLEADFHTFSEARHPRDLRGKFRKGDHVNYQHDYFGRVPATVTKVTSRRVFLTSSDPRVRDTSMTHNQADRALSKTSGARTGSGGLSEGGSVGTLGALLARRRNALPRDDGKAA